MQYVDIPQGTDEWLRARALDEESGLARLTSSRLGQCSTTKQIADLIARAEDPLRFAERYVVNEHMQWGKDHEDDAVDALVDRFLRPRLSPQSHGFVIRSPGLLVHPKYPRFGGSLDAIWVLVETATGCVVDVAAIEVKCPSATRHAPGHDRCIAERETKMPHRKQLYGNMAILGTLLGLPTIRGYLAYWRPAYTEVFATERMDVFQLTNRVIYDWGKTFFEKTLHLQFSPMQAPQTE